MNDFANFARKFGIFTVKRSLELTVNMLRLTANRLTSRWPPHEFHNLLNSLADLSRGLVSSTTY